MLRLRLLLLICGTALAQLGFINPPPRRPSSTLLFYSQNSEERLEWEAQYSAYTIYLWQVLPEGEAVMLGPVFSELRSTYDLPKDAKEIFRYYERDETHVLRLYVPIG